MSSGEQGFGEGHDIIRPVLRWPRVFRADLLHGPTSQDNRGPPCGNGATSVCSAEHGADNRAVRVRITAPADRFDQRRLEVVRMPQTVAGGGERGDDPSHVLPTVLGTPTRAHA